MALNITPSSISFSLIKNELITYVQNKPDGQGWKDFLSSSTGTVIIELLAGTSAYLAFKAMVERRETYLNYAVNRSSVIGIAENVFYNVRRGKNPHLNLVVYSSEVVTINKWDVVGLYGEYNIIAMETVTLYPSIDTVLEVVIGDLISNVTYDINTSNTDVFRILANNVSDDIRLFYKKTSNDNYIDLDKEGAMSTVPLDLLEDKFLVLTNPYDSVDVYYLNNKPSSLNLGDEVRLTTSGTLPAPLLPNTPYYVIPRGENLISLASLEINAMNDIEIDLTSVGSGTHLINSMYSFNLEGFDINPISPTGLTTNYMAVNGIYPKYKYESGTTLMLEYIELKEINDVVLTDVEFYFGSIQHEDSRTKILSTYITPESTGVTKVNAPVFFETQFVVKGREDYPKILRRLDTTFIDTSSRDLSPAIVEVSYLRNDKTFLNNEERFNLTFDLNKYRSLGLPPTQIADPRKVLYSLNIDLTLYSGVTIPILVDVLKGVLVFEPENNGIVNLRTDKLKYILDLYQLENEIVHLLNVDSKKYIQVARVSMKTTVYANNTLYKRGDFVTHASNSTYMFECVRPLGKNLIDFTTDFASNTIPTYLTSTSHGLVDGQAVRVIRTGLGVLPAPLSDEMLYYVKYRSTNEFSLTKTYNGDDISFTDNGSGISGINNVISGLLFTTSYTPTPTGDENIEFTFATPHGLEDDEPVRVYSSGTLPNPLSNNVIYYVTVVSSTKIYLKTLIPATTTTLETYSDPITLTDNGSGIFTLHNGISVGYSSGTTPSFGTASPTNTEFIDGGVIWKAILKTSTKFQVGWNEYINFDYEYTTTI